MWRRTRRDEEEEGHAKVDISMVDDEMVSGRMRDGGALGKTVT